MPDCGWAERARQTALPALCGLATARVSGHIACPPGSCTGAGRLSTAAVSSALVTATNQP